MNVNDFERVHEAEGCTGRGLLANEMLRHDVYSLPDEEVYVFCPECGEMGESFALIDHRDWCFYCERICPGTF